MPMDMDLSIALAHVEDDRQLLGELATIFVQDCPNLMNEVRKSIAVQDCPGLERAAHTWKGRFACFGIRYACEQAADLERMGRTKNLAGAQEAFDVLDSEMKTILPEIESLTRHL